MSQLAVLSKPAELLTFLQRSESAIKMALPKHLTPDRMMRLALTAFSTTPKLRECTAQSILASVVVASQLGLEPGVAGQGYLIPYGNTCTFVPGWQGLVGLLNNSGRATAWTGAVYEGDVWDFQLGSNPRCIHIPGENYGDVEKIIWVYACGKVNGSEQPVIEAWNMARVWKHRDRYNKVGNRHYSFQHPEMYARKVVLLQVLKYMPRSIELNNAIVAANAAEEGNSTKVEDGVIVEVEAAAQVEAPERKQRQPRQQQTQPPAEEQQKEKSGADDQSQRGGEHAAPIEETGGAATENHEQETITEDPASLRAALMRRDLDEAQVVAFLKKTHKCGVACKSLSDVAYSGRQWLAENIDSAKDEIAAL